MKKMLAILLAAILLCSCTALAEKPDMANSYCNPLNLAHVDVRAGSTTQPTDFPDLTGDAEKANNWLNTEVWTASMGRSMLKLGGGTAVQENAYRTTADIFVYQLKDGTLVMHASDDMLQNGSFGACWTSTDYLNWEYHEMNLCVTAPTFIEIGDKYYLCGNSSDVYVSDYPWGPWESMGKFNMLDGSKRGFSDVNFFMDDDGRLYLSYGIGSPIQGVELDPADPTHVLTEPVILWINDGRNVYERFGSGNANAVGAYTEGSQIFKYNGIYYLQVSTNGTESISYCMCMKKSTEGPLSGYTYQKNNPVTVNFDNFVPAAGHGCFLVDKDNRLICFYTQVIGLESLYDRRVGMDICWVDENNEIHCNITDTPQLVPTLIKNPAAGGDLGLANLHTIGGNAWVSSYKEGHKAFYALDENSTTWWQPAADDENPVYMAACRGIFDVYAVQLNWKELGQFTRDNAVQFTLEYYNIDTNTWDMLYDASENTIGRAVEYITINEGVRTIAVRLNILGTTENIDLGVTGFRIFGENVTMTAEHHRWDNQPLY